MKKCSGKCGLVKPFSEFHRDTGRLDGRQRTCKACVKQRNEERREERAQYFRDHYQANKERKNAQSQAYYQANRERLDTRRFERKYGMTREEAAELLAEQGGICPICQSDEPGVKGWCVDHCHTTGRVRGILCQKCNSGIGFLRDDPAFLQRAMTYLQAPIDALKSEVNTYA